MALREHGRERVGKMRLAQFGTVIASIGGALLGFGDLGGQVASGVGQLTLLKYGRDDETEADLVGLDLTARAGYDPRAGLVVWQKMASSASGQPPEWLSSHPSHTSRIKEIASHLDATMPLYAPRGRPAGRRVAALPVQCRQADPVAAEDRVALTGGEPTFGARASPPTAAPTFPRSPAPCPSSI